MKKIRNGVLLHIDTSQTQTVVARLRFPDDHAVQRVEHLSVLRSQRILPLIVALMRENGISWNQIAEIEVHSGPGSYTGLRVGFSVANTLGYLLGVRVNGKRVGQQDVPQYSA